MGHRTPVLGWSGVAPVGPRHPSGAPVDVLRLPGLAGGGRGGGHDPCRSGGMVEDADERARRADRRIRGRMHPDKRVSADARRTLHNTALLIGFEIANPLLSILLVGTMTRMLGAEGTGAYNLLLNFFFVA